MSKNYQKEYTVKALNRFLENAFEIAFGDDAINKDYTPKEVIDRLYEFSQIKDHCDQCGCNEFLCGHNKR
jgi:hypothetical protein